MADIKLKTFKSRKNQVHLIKNSDDNTLYVEKIMITKTSLLEKEVYYLKSLHDQGLAVPKVIDHKEDRVHMAYVGPTTLLDCLTQWEAEQKDPLGDNSISAIFIQLIQWLDSFYGLTYRTTGKKIRLGDIHFRNFLIEDGVIYGIDFEECCEGTREMDGGRLCAYLLTYDPIFTKLKIMYTIHLIDVLVNQFHYAYQPLMEHMQIELMAINQRRWHGEKEQLVKQVIIEIEQKIRQKDDGIEES